MEYVILVDENDKDLGVMEKMQAHEKAALHRAFSVYLHDGKGNVLLQQRALSKYHSGGLWTNACCSHPRNNESLEEAVHRRLVEELGIDCPVVEVMDFLYKAELDHGLTEHELDHVFVGEFRGQDIPFEPSEVAAVKWMAYSDMMVDMEARPDQYTEWFKIIMQLAHEKGLAAIIDPSA